jgi:hypothetical protein
MLSSIEGGAIKAFPYIGVSKLSCLMCSSYIESYSQTVTDAISIRGCHGKVYSSWAWPTMLDAHHERIRSIFLEKMRQELKLDFERFTEYERTCCKSDSSVESMSESEYAELGKRGRKKALRNGTTFMVCSVVCENVFSIVHPFNRTDWLMCTDLVSA